MSFDRTNVNPGWMKPDFIHGRGLPIAFFFATIKGTMSPIFINWVSGVGFTFRVNFCWVFVGEHTYPLIIERGTGNFLIDVMRR
jgi:hypothetical protein